MQDTKEQSFEKIMEYEKKIHEKNQQRIKIGIRLVIIIPLIFLAVMFKLDSSKVVFLVLWIVSLFAISLYLIVVEYMDYQMQEKLKELGIKEEDADIKRLINDNLVVEKVIESTGLLEDKQAQDVEEATLEEQVQAQSRMRKMPVKYTAEPHVKRVVRSNATPRVKGEVVSPVMQEIEEDVVRKPKIHEVIEEAGIHEEPVVEQHHTDELTQAEEELVESIRKYVATLGRQAAATPVIDDVQRKDAQDYAAMRKARAASRRPKSQDEVRD